jgi:hypothetical protein
MEHKASLVIKKSHIPLETRQAWRRESPGCWWCLYTGHSHRLHAGGGLPYFFLYAILAATLFEVDFRFTGRWPSGNGRYRSGDYQASVRGQCIDPVFATASTSAACAAGFSPKIYCRCS